jgi:uncharacterized Zn finger protein
VLLAEVEGSDYAPYRVSITSGAGGEIAAECSCPYGAEWGGWCKHIVATLLMTVRAPGAIEEQPPLAKLLAELNREQLESLLHGLAGAEPDLYDVIAARIALFRAEAPGTTPGHPPVDGKAIRRQVRATLRSLDRMRRSEAYWHVGGVVDQVRRTLEQAEAFVQAGDGRSALAVLEAITSAYVADWTELDDSDGEVGAFFEELGAAWTEALLVVDLTPDERRGWEEKLAEWDEEISEYGDMGFAVARAAARYGWDTLEDQDTWHSDELTDARLNVLERQGRFQEALRLAEAAGRAARYVALLVELGRVPEAVDHALAHLDTPDEVLAFAQRLHGRGESGQALRIAEHGLTLHGFNKAALATWLRDRATEQGETEQALCAAGIAFREAPGLEAYLQVQGLAGESWPELREALLEHVRRAPGHKVAGRVEVLLHEGLTGDALDIVQGTWDYALIGRVVDSALQSHPERVIPICRAQADSIMDRGQAGAYDHAVRW